MRKHPLVSVENRLRCKFPTSFRATYAGANVFTEVEGWEIHTPDEMVRTASVDGGHESPHVDGVAVGEDAGGNWLLLRFAPDGKKLLDKLWCWDHETCELTEVANELASLLGNEDSAQEAATEMLGIFAKDAITKGAERREEYWDRYVAKEDLDVGGVCKFCGSGLAGERVCSVCDRRVEEPADPKSPMAPAQAEAARIVGVLLSDGRLELVSPSSRAHVIEITARAMDEADGFAPAVVAAELLDRWENTPEIAEVFIDDADLVSIVSAALARNT
jgi:hypothetical protein